MKKLCCVTTLEITMESFVIPAMRLFKERGYDVTLICNMTDKFKEKYGGEFNLLEVKMKRGFALKDIFTKPFEFRKIFKREKFDYVQYATTNAGWYASMGAWMAKVPVRVYCLWGLLYSASSGIKRKLFWLAEKVPCVFSNHFTCASNINMELAISDKLCKREQVSVIGAGGTIGVDLKDFDILKRSQYQAEMFDKYPVLKGKMVYGYVGRIDVDKGINELLSAFTKLYDSNTALLLIGPFDDLRSGLDEELLNKAKNNRNIIFTGFTREVAKHLSAVDILVHPTYREGFSMVIQQAMAMGCAIVTTDIPGPSEVIVENECGLLVPVKNSEELALAMKTLKENQALREAFVVKGLVRVREKFERNHMLELTYQDRIRMMNQ